MDGPEGIDVRNASVTSTVRILRNMRDGSTIELEVNPLGTEPFMSFIVVA